MLKNVKLIIIGVMILLAVLLTACGKSNLPQPNGTQPKLQQNKSSGNTAQNSKTFTKDELKKYDGQNGNSAYVAVDGIVYDVTNAKGWHNGKHQGYQAGTDLSEAIKKSPHGKSVLSGLTVVGKYKG